MHFPQPHSPRFLRTAAIIVAIGISVAHSSASPVEKPEFESTLTCLSVKWPRDSVSELSSEVAIRYRRQGETEWRLGLRLFPVNIEATSRETDQIRRVQGYAGSLFGLAPGTKYEIELTESVTGKTQVMVQHSVETRHYPKLDAKGRTFRVHSKKQLLMAQSNLRPGDRVLLFPGVYDADATWVIGPECSGNLEAPVLFQGAGTDKVQFGGMEIEASYIWVDNVSVGNGGIHASKKNAPNGVVLTRNLISKAFHCIDVAGRNWIITDNTLIGHSPSAKSLSGEGIELMGRGHVVAFNDISQTADGISYGDGHIDVHNNVIHDVTDDFFEPDYAWDNYRIFENRTWGGANNGLSFQPMHGGPWYFVRNQLTGTSYNPFKLREAQGAKIVVGNTIVSSQSVQRADRLFTEGIWCNNYWVVSPRDHLGYGSMPDAAKMRLWGNNRYGAARDAIFKFDGRQSLARLQRRQIETGSALVGGNAAEDLPEDAKLGTERPILPTLSGDLVDSGAVDQVPGLNNVVGTYLGSKPDCGALELGLGEYWVGPRQFHPNLAIGIPKGWKPVPPAQVAAISDDVEKGASHVTMTLSHPRDPTILLHISHQELSPDDAWSRMYDYLQSAEKSGKKHPNVTFRDGLAAVVTPLATGDQEYVEFRAACVDSSGLLRLSATMPASDYARNAHDLYTIVRSLYYEWPLPDLTSGVGTSTLK